MPGIAKPARLPVSTYRIQLNRKFGFADLDKIADYLQQIGITDCYLSPILMAKAGSVHGYDVVNPTVLNPELGTEEEFQQLVRHLQSLGMGIIVDVVPNHMCISDSKNAWWFDVLENGPSSPFAQFFDIEWHPPRENLANKVLLPVLDRQYGQALEDQRIQIQYSAGSFLVSLNGSQLPVNPRTWPIVMHPALQTLRSRLGESSAEVMELESILTALRYLPARTETDEERVRERQREKEIVKRRLSELEAGSQIVRDAIGQAINVINGVPGDPSSFDTLEEILEAQAYRLSFWRVAAEEINYRRFFDINDLAAIRIENPAVFQEVHRKILDLVHQGVVTGIRVDHADGLFDPLQYFTELQAACVEQTGQKPSHSKSFFVIAEKILIGDEHLRPDWQIHGTTGYEFLNLLNGVFVSRPSRKVFRAFFARLAGTFEHLDDVLYGAKKLILSASMPSELNVLSRRLDRICQQQRHSRDFTLENLRFALAEVIACFPVYRTYTRLGQTEVKPEDSRHTLSAIRMAKARNPASTGDVFDFIGSVLLLQDPADLTDVQRSERRLFVMKFQQLTSPVMAKGLEDTAFYRSFPLASLNEVGGSPDLFGISVRHFHEKNRERAVSWPHSLLATSTHDTKWGEDARVRLDVLSEIPLRWIRAVHHWQKLNKEHQVSMDGTMVPDKAEEYRLYQALVASWPPGPFHLDEHGRFVERVNAYMNKAAREAKLHTSWIQPNQTYEHGLSNFVERVLDPSPNNRFLKEFGEFHRGIARAGMLTSLSQVLLKIVSPGIPDFYQGCELWNFSLVDPDNRRPVDFACGQAIIAVLDSCGEEKLESMARELMGSLEDGRAKLWISSRALRFRRANPELFSLGTYLPLRALGDRRSHVIAFARGFGPQLVIAVAGRLFAKLPVSEGTLEPSSLWIGSELALPRGMAGGSYRDVFTRRVLRPEVRQGRSVLPLREVFSCYPVALLEKLQE